jgi:electron transfer flavoprotein alpha/beta subunit
VRDVMMSYRQPLTKWTVEDLGIDAAAARAGNAYYEVAELAIPRKEMQCEFFTGETLEEQVEALAKRLAQITGAL